jgi:hypothetical protein
MQSEGPYRAEHWEGQNEFVVVGPGWENRGGTYTKNEAGIAARFANLAHAEGRKSMEKYAEESINLGRAESIVLNKEIRRLEKLFEEREQEIQDLRFAIGESDKDFKELLELANGIRDKPWLYNFKFAAWKKASGIS